MYCNEPPNKVSQWQTAWYFSTMDGAQKCSRLLAIHSKWQVSTQKSLLSPRYREVGWELFPCFSSQMLWDTNMSSAEAIYHHIQSDLSLYLACVTGSTIVNDDEWLFMSCCCLWLGRAQSLSCSIASLYTSEETFLSTMAERKRGREEGRDVYFKVCCGGERMHLNTKVLFLISKIKTNPSRVSFMLTMWWFQFAYRSFHYSRDS